MPLPLAQVALRTLQVWEAVVQNEGDSAKPFVNNLLPFVVSRASARVWSSGWAPACAFGRRGAARGLPPRTRAFA